MLGWTCFITSTLTLKFMLVQVPGTFLKKISRGNEDNSMFQFYLDLIPWSLISYAVDDLCCGINLKFLSGKSVIGGRKALENRRFIKHVTSRQYSSGFHGDLNKALNKIMTGNKLMADRSKEKRKVVKQQTKETKTSMTESIKLAKVNSSQQV